MRISHRPLSLPFPLNSLATSSSTHGDRDDIDAVAVISVSFAVMIGVVEGCTSRCGGQNAKVEPAEQRELAMELQTMLDHARTLASAVTLLLR